MTIDENQRETIDWSCRNSYGLIEDFQRLPIRTRMELAHFDRVQIQIFFKKADFFRPVLREFMITL